MSSENFYSKLGHGIDHDSHVTTFQDFADAHFKVYAVPRMSCHQVANQGGLTVKMSWSRMAMKGMSSTMYYELPLYRW